MNANRLVGVFLPALLACIACRTGAGGVRLPDGSFPLRVNAAKAVGTSIVVNYTLTNDTTHHVWVGCPDFECAVPGTFGARVDGVSSEGTIVRLSSRIIAENDGPVLAPEELVPFRRVAPGSTRWHAEFELTAAAARAIQAATGPVRIELAVGILPCPHEELLPRVEHLGIHVVGPNHLVDCFDGGSRANDKQRAIDIQHVTVARGTLTIVRRAR
jgi:hypothetical protein